jgi:flagellar biosynthetic protein FliR
MFTVGTAELEAFLAAWFYPFVRILALATSAPIFSHRSVPRATRVALAALVTLLVAPTLAPAPFVSPFSAAGVVLIVQQVLIGVAIGFAMQVVFAAADLAGEIIGLQMGLSFATFVDAQNADPIPIVGSFLSLTMMLVFLALNGHLMLLAGLVGTFESFPVAGGKAIGALDTRLLVLTASELFSLGVALALPVIGAMLLANLALGVLTRTAPQLNLFAVGFPITLATGLAMIALAMPFIVPAMETALLRVLSLIVR